MSASRFSRELGAGLLARGLPLSYVRRTVAELGDHQRDLRDDFLAAGYSAEEAEQRACEAMGDVTRLSEELRDRLRSGTLLGRHPAWSFLLLPVLTFVLFAFLDTLIVVLLGALIKLCGMNYYQEPLRSILMSAFELLPFLTCVLPAVVLCFMNRRCCCEIKWAGYACLLLGFLGYSLSMQLGLNPPEIGRHTSTLSIGLGLGMVHDWQAPLRFLLPLIAFLGYWGISRALRAEKFLESGSVRSSARL